MDGRPTTFWGKLERDAGGAVVRWHPLLDHCADVAACSRALLDVTLLRSRLARLAGLETLSDAQCDRLAVLAAFHDVGKFNLGFQNKARERADFVAGHLREVLALFARQYEETGRLGQALQAERWEGWAEGQGAYELLIASISHHGRPLAIGGGAFQRRLWQPKDVLDPFEGISELGRKVQEWFPRAFGEAEPLPESAPLQHAFSGLVMLADWLGSDTQFFPYAEPGEGDRFPRAQDAARRVLEKVGLDPRGARVSLRDEGGGFGDWFGFGPRAAQETILELPAVNGPPLTVLEAETGAGKTEAALTRFLELFRAGLVDGLYFALPTRTAATQIFERVQKAIANAFPDPERRPPVTLAVPGYLRVDDREGRRLAPFEVLWNDDEADRFRYRGWAAESPKRYLAGSVVVGTIDQALLATLTVGHAHLRNTSLLRQLLVVDEVHASDHYMTRILEALLRRHLAAGGHAFLMSATLGAAARVRLMRPGARTAPPPLEESIATPFPLVSTRGGGEDRRIPVPTPGKPKAVSVESWNEAGDPEAIAARSLEEAGRGARVLVIRNTVADCVATQRALEEQAAARGLEPLLFRCEGAAAPHHARFAQPDRVLLDRAIEAAMGKGSAEEGCVVVATQTVQQSLDLDADLLLSDLCPIDVLLQRIGRLHRHADRSRPKGFDEARAVVLTPASRDLSPLIRRDGDARGPHGLGTVYQDLRILEASWRMVESKARWEIPLDNRLLVESSTHPEALRQLANELGGAWGAHSNRMEGIAFAQGALASNNLVQWTKPFSDPAVAFEKPVERWVSTRLGEGDRRLAFDRALPGPFGAEVRELTLPAHLASEASDEEVPTRVRAEAGPSIHFAFGGRDFVYDRLGLRALRTREVE